MLTIEQVLKAASFQNAELLTCSDLDVPAVDSVTVGEVPDIANWLTGGEMVLTTLFSAREAGIDKFDIVESIIEGPAGALVVKLGRFVEALPPEIIELANERKFPIISLPSDVRWTNVIKDISRLLGQEELAKLTWLETIRRQFGRINAGDGGLLSVAKTLAGLAGHTVVIEDLLGGVFAHSLEPEQLPAEHTKTPVSLQLGKDSGRFRISQNISAGSFLYYEIIGRKAGGIRKLAFELDDGHDRCGYLVVIIDEDDGAPAAAEMRLLAIDKAVEAANIELSRMRASLDAEMRLMGNLFSMLRSGNLTHEQAVSRASFLQIDLTHGFIVCAVDLVHAAHDSADEGALRSIEQMCERAFSIVKRIVSVDFPGSLVALDGKGIHILLVPARDQEAQARAKMVGLTVEKVAQGLREALPSVTFRIGVSAYHVNAAEIHVAHTEAVTAALIASATGQAGGIGNFRELGLYKLLLHLNSSHPEEARRFYLDTLGPVEEYDRKREGGLLNTLEVFFAARENINETAAQLFTHRHTIRYRLQRIAELSGLDPFDPDGREILRVAVKLRQLILYARS
ncbi:MAG: PucR family transcriptional regulator ligand-binding domain-containing protein [Candidatus Aquicultor sp.]|nr:PucR family transcriptional regulator ligand-binding domain-containing protein [Candidatus Aquicultor sp.]